LDLQPWGGQASRPFPAQCGWFRQPWSRWSAGEKVSMDAKDSGRRGKGRKTYVGSCCVGVLERVDARREADATGGSSTENGKGGTEHRLWGGGGAQHNCTRRDGACLPARRSTLCSSLYPPVTSAAIRLPSFTLLTPRSRHFASMVVTGRESL
jgi:hypothetical protein